MLAGAALVIAAVAALTMDFSRRWYCSSWNKSKPSVRWNVPWNVPYPAWVWLVETMTRPRAAMRPRLVSSFSRS